MAAADVRHQAAGLPEDRSGPGAYPGGWLAGLGYDWHNVMHLIMGPVTEAVWNALAEKRPFDRADYLRQLAELPGDWPSPQELG